MAEAADTTASEVQSESAQHPVSAEVHNSLVNPAADEKDKREDQEDAGNATDALSLRQQSGSPTSDAMWAGVEDPADASSRLSWDDLGVKAAAARLAGGGGAGGGDDGRRETHTELSSATPELDGGGLRLDVGAWEKGMGDVINLVGLDRPAPFQPLADRLQDAVNKLRILEEDRDVLSNQAVKLQRMLDSEREDRQLAQKAQSAAADELRELDDSEGAVHVRDANRLQELEATAALLRTKLERHRRNNKVPAADVIDSLKTRTQDLEEVAARKDREQLQWQV